MDFNQKMGKTVAAKLALTFLPQALNLSPLAREVDLLPTRAEVYDISWVLHCFDVALHKPALHLLMILQILTK